VALHFRRAVIHGVGLLGGSLGMALRRRAMAERVVGLGRSRKRLERARQLGAVDDLTTDAAEALEGADALICCLPPRALRKKWAALAPLVPDGAFVTDVGSVKRESVAEAERRFGDRALFIGSHPMAGSEMSGVEAARGDLFEGAACFITPTPRTPGAAISTAARMWSGVGARVAVADPARHDRLMAGLSHLPHLTAVALVETVYAGGDATVLLRAVAGPGFRDATRIAAGDAALWEQIFSENAPALRDSLDGLIDILSEWRDLLGREESAAALVERLERSAERRAQLAPGASGHPT
jgi:prephenate dehydrogenase